MALNIKKKQSFILLEAMVALILVILCAIPMITSPIKAYKLELKNLQKAEEQRIAELSFTEIKEKLYSTLHNWESFKKPSKTYFLTDIPITFRGASFATLKRSYKIRMDSPKKINKGKCSLAKLTINIQLWEKHDHAKQRDFEFICLAIKEI